MPTPIGELDVIIQGDYSQLTTDFAAVASQSTAAGKTVAEAFTAGAASGDKLSDALKGVSQNFRFAEEMTDRGRTALEKLKEEYRTGTGTFEKYGDSLRSASTETSRLGSTSTQARDELGRFAATSRDVADNVESIRPKLQGVGQAFSSVGTLLAGVSAPLIAIGTVAVKSAADFELGMRKVTSLMRDATEADFKNLSDKTLELSTRMGVDAVKATGALYEAISAGVPKDNAIDFLAVASKTAVAGVTDTKVAVDALTTVLNAYHLPATKAREVSDAMFQAVNVGKFTFEQLASAMGKTSGIAADVGISFKEVLAAASSISLQGFTVSEAMTQIQSAIKAIIAPNKEMVAVLKQTEYASGQAMLAALGFEGSLQRIRQVVGDNDAAMAKAFGRIEGFKGLLALTGDNAKLAADHLKGMEDASRGLGATTDAYNEINKSAARQFEILKTEIKNSAIELGTALLPSLRDVVEMSKPFIQSAKDAAHSFSELPQHIRTTSVEVTALTGALGLGLLALNPFANSIERLISFLPALGVGLGQAGIMFGTFSAGLIITLDNINQLKERWDSLSEGFQKRDIFATIKTGAAVKELESLGIKSEDLKKALESTRKEIDFSKLVIEGDLGPSLRQLGTTLTTAKERYDDFGIKVTFVASEVSKMTEEIKKSTSAKERALEAAKETLANLKAEGAGANELAEAQRRVTTAANALAPAFHSLAQSQKAHKITLDDYHKGLEDIEKATRKAYDIAALHRDVVAQYGENSMQAAVSSRLLESALKAIGLASITDLEPSLAKVNNGIVILKGHLYDLDAEVPKVAGSIAKVTSAITDMGSAAKAEGSNEREIFNDVNVILGGTFQAVGKVTAALKDGTVAAVMLGNQGGDALHKITNEAGLAASQIKIFASHAGTASSNMSTLNEYVDQFGTVIRSSFINTGVEAAEELSEAISRLEQQWNSFTSSVGSFAPGGGTFKNPMGTDRRGRGMSFDIAGQFRGLTPAEITRLAGELTAGGSPFSPGQRALDAYVQALAQQAIDDYFAAHPGASFFGTGQTEAQGSDTGRPERASTPSGRMPTLSIPGPTWDQRNAQGFFQPVLPVIPPLTEALTNLDQTFQNTMPSITTALTNLQPAIEQATQQFMASAGTTAALLTSIVGPSATPSAVGGGILPAVMTAPLSRDGRIVLNVNVNNADAAKVGQEIVTQMQRAGIRF